MEREPRLASAHPGLGRIFDIKRIIALPGDTVAIEGGRVTVNSRAITTTDAARSYTDINGRQSLVYIAHREF